MSFRRELHKKMGYKNFGDLEQICKFIKCKCKESAEKQLSSVDLDWQQLGLKGDSDPLIPAIKQIFSNPLENIRVQLYGYHDSEHVDTVTYQGLKFLW